MAKPKTQKMSWFLYWKSLKKILDSPEIAKIKPDKLWFCWILALHWAPPLIITPEKFFLWQAHESLLGVQWHPQTPHLSWTKETKQTRWRIENPPFFFFSFSPFLSFPFPFYFFFPYLFPFSKTLNPNGCVSFLLYRTLNPNVCVFFFFYKTQNPYEQGPAPREREGLLHFLLRSTNYIEPWAVCGLKLLMLHIRVYFVN